VHSSISLRNGPFLTAVLHWFYNLPRLQRPVLFFSLSAVSFRRLPSLAETDNVGDALSREPAEEIGASYHPREMLLGGSTLRFRLWSTSIWRAAETYDKKQPYKKINNLAQERLKFGVRFSGEEGRVAEVQRVAKGMCWGSLALIEAWTSHAAVAPAFDWRTPLEALTSRTAVAPAFD
jgi:hypothetical protein